MPSARVRRARQQDWATATAATGSDCRRRSGCQFAKNRQKITNCNSSWETFCTQCKTITTTNTMQRNATLQAHCATQGVSLYATRMRHLQCQSILAVVAVARARLVWVFWLSLLLLLFVLVFWLGAATHCASKSTSWFACQRKWMGSSANNANNDNNNNNNCNLHAATATKHSNSCGYQICLPVLAKRAAKWHSSGGRRWLSVRPSICLSICRSAVLPDYRTNVYEYIGA